MYYRMSPWRIGVVAVDVVIALGVALGVIAMVKRTKNEKEHPEHYKAKKSK